MKNKILLIMLFINSLILFCFSLSRANELQINVKIERVANIAYLPIYLNIEFYNNSSQEIFLQGKPFFEDYFQLIVEGPKALKCFDETICKMGEIRLFSLKPKEKYIYSLEVSSYGGILDPGIYRVKIMWDSRKAPKGYQGYSESEWLDIRVDEPIGEDKMFIDELKKRFPTSDSSYKCIANRTLPMDLVEKYPTSTYAGWALIGNYENYIKRIKCLKPDEYEKEASKRAKQIREINEKDEDNKAYKNMISKFQELQKAYREKRILQLELFTSAREDFVLIDLMRYELAGWYHNAGENEKAIKLLDWLVNNAKDEDVIYCAKQKLKIIKK
jgi:hypothetical protein